jgi:anti-anti-sigma regulatory factor
MIKRPVSVQQVPRTISSHSEMELLRQFAMLVENGRPRFVLDCSKMEGFGPIEMRLLLCCLEEAMKHNGDVRLAVLNPLVHANLRHSGVGRLFEIFDTTENAVRSYQARAASTVPLSFQSLQVDTEFAA